MMKAYFFILTLVVCCLLAGCKQGKTGRVALTAEPEVADDDTLMPVYRQNAGDIVITGRLEGVEDGTIMGVYKLEGSALVPIMWDTLHKGKFGFVLADSLAKADRVKISSRRAPGFPPASLDVWIVPGADIKIYGKDKLLLISPSWLDRKVS